MLHIWQPWWKNMVIFGSITRQYFQKCKLAWVLTLFFRKMTIKWWQKRFFSKKTKNRNFWQPCCSNRLENAKNEKFGQKYVGIDTNIVRFCWLRAVREKYPIFLKRTRHFRYRAKIWLDHFSKKMYQPICSELAGTYYSQRATS